MFIKGNYLCKTVTWNNQKEWLVCNMKEDRSYHVHLPYNKGNAARMIAIRANEGKIPEHYPDWMVNDINRLWYGKGFMTRKDLNNENMMTNEDVVRFKQRKKKKDKCFRKTKCALEADKK